MVTTFGDYSENVVTQAKFYLRLAFLSSSFKDQWNNVSLSANFLANFFETFFRKVNSLSSEQGLHLSNQVQSSISYVANELIENAVKFNVDETMEIGLAVYYEENQVVFLVWNSVDELGAGIFQALIRTITVGDVEELLIRRMEENFLNQCTNSSSSGLGLLTIMHDYGAKLGWRFETVSNKPGLKLLTTMVSLPLAERVELVEV